MADRRTSTPSSPTTPTRLASPVTGSGSSPSRATPTRSSTTSTDRDASLLIAYLDADDAHHGASELLLEREIGDDFSTSPLTLAEVLVGPTRADRLDAAVAALRELEIVELSFPAEPAVELARLRVLTGLRMPDCCVLLAAQEGAARVASFHAALTKAAEGLGLTMITS